MTPARLPEVSRPPISKLTGRPGEVIVGQGAIATQRPGPTCRLLVENTSVWPVVITSHFHFFEANPRLRFDRGRAFGLHLDIASGASIRFQPGESRPVDLVRFAGQTAIYGFNGLTNGVLGTGEELDQQRASAVALARSKGFLDSQADDDTGPAQEV